MIPILLLAAMAMPADLAKAVTDYDQAQIRGDRAALERLLADDYLLINSRGARESKAELIADYTAPGFRLDPFEITEAVERVWSHGAVMGGVVRLKGMDEGKPFAATLRFADVWARRKGKWQVVYTQVSPAPSETR